MMRLLIGVGMVAVALLCVCALWAPVGVTVSSGRDLALEEIAAIVGGDDGPGLNEHCIEGGIGKDCTGPHTGAQNNALCWEHEGLPYPDPAPTPIVLWTGMLYGECLLGGDANTCTYKNGNHDASEYLCWWNVVVDSDFTYDDVKCTENHFCEEPEWGWKCRQALYTEAQGGLKNFVHDMKCVVP